jgi:hypothetical protein
MFRVKPEEFCNLDLEFHHIAWDIPLHDVWAIDLPGGGDEITILDVRTIFQDESLENANPIVGFLFALRGWLGNLFRWDTEAHKIETPRKDSFVNCLSDNAKRHSLQSPGSSDGRFSLVYLLAQEWVAELRNETVHALIVFALKKTTDGHRLYLAVYVKSVSWFTPLYMALIDPFRYLFVYPAMLNKLRRVWVDRYPPTVVGITE